MGPMGLVMVATPAELTSAVAAAKAGDEIVLADGTYPLTGVTCAGTGSEAQPIIVRAANPLAAHVELDALEGFKVTGAHWHFENLDVRGVCAVAGTVMVPITDAISTAAKKRNVPILALPYSLGKIS